MIITIRLGHVRCMSLEWNKSFGFQPAFKKISYHCETIVDMPYTQIIFTSGKWTPLRRAANDKQKNDEAAEYFAGTYHDRS